MSPQSRAAAVAIAVLIALPLAGCASLFHADGDDLAHDAAENVAVQIGSHRENSSQTTVEDMVTWWVPEDVVSTGAGQATVEALEWSGHIGSEVEATIDVRIHADVESYSSPSFGGRSHSAGDATVCYRLVWPRYEEAKRSEIPCPDTPAPPRPNPPVHPELTEEDSARVADILTTMDGLDTIDDALHDAFPADGMSIDTVVFNDEIVVAVGIPAEQECILAVRNAAGEVAYPSYRQISLAPGEVGCSVSLYTAPPF